MTKQKRIDRDKQILSLIYLCIKKFDYFDEYKDMDMLITYLRYYNNYTEKEIKRVFWYNYNNNINFQEFLDDYVY